MKKIIYVLILLFLVGCQRKENITIAANEWIGYAPLFYMNEKGWLKELNIRLIRTISLGESLNLYESGLIEGFAGTQFEYKKDYNSLRPVLLIDRSYGGDVVLSNKTIEELKKANKIYVYLEMNSVNSLLLEQFIKLYHINKNKLILINKDQQQIVNSKFDFSKNIIVVSYIPYSCDLKKKGFKIIDSTKNDRLLIIDALFLNKHYIKNLDIKKLRFYLLKAIDEIKTHPKKVFKDIKKYYTYDYNYSSFLEDLKKIKWIVSNKKILLQLLNDNI